MGEKIDTNSAKMGSQCTICIRFSKISSGRPRPPPLLREDKKIPSLAFLQQLKLALHQVVRASAGCLRPKISQIAMHSQGTRKAHYGTRTEHLRFFTPRITRRGPQKRIGMHIIFYVRRAISDSRSARKGLARRTYVTLAFSLLVTGLKW